MIICNYLLIRAAQPFDASSLSSSHGVPTLTAPSEVQWSVWNHAWLDMSGSEYLFGHIGSVYASRLPHRAVFSEDYLSTCLTAPQLVSLNRSGKLMGACNIVSVPLSSSHFKSLLKLVSTFFFWIAFKCDRWTIFYWICFFLTFLRESGISSERQRPTTLFGLAGSHCQELGCRRSSWDL